MEEIKYNNIMNSRNVLSKMIDLLMPIYLEDYGEENKDTIKKRVRNFVFIPDSNPVTTAEYIASNLDSINNSRYIRKCVAEYKDYNRVEKKCDIKNNHLLESFLYNHYGRDVLSSAIGVMDLDFEAYSFENSRLLNNCDLETRRELLKRQQKYKADCCMLGIDPITNMFDIDEILKYKRELISYKNEQLVRETRWGKRIKRELKSLYHFIPSDLDLAELLFDENAATTAVMKDTEGNLKTVVNIPLIANADNGLDKIIFHELRHVVETDETHTGIYVFDKDKYNCFNEIRTEYNAISDSQRIGSNQTFFSKNSKVQSLYEPLIGECEGFVCVCKELLDIAAFNGGVEALEETIDKEALEKLENRLFDKINSRQNSSKVKIKV